MTGIPVALVVNGLLIVGLSNLGKDIEITMPTEMPIDILVTDLKEPILEPPPKPIVPSTPTERELPEQVNQQTNDYSAKSQQLPEKLPQQIAKSSEPRQDLPKQPSKPNVEDIPPKQNAYTTPPENLEKEISKTTPDNILTPSLPENEAKLAPKLPTEDVGDLPSQVNDHDEPREISKPPLQSLSKLPPEDVDNKPSQVEEPKEAPQSLPNSDRVLKDESQEKSPKVAHSDNLVKDKKQSTYPSERSEVTNPPQAKITEPKPQVDRPAEKITPTSPNENKVKFGCIQCSKPSFPQSARQKGIQGEVRISLDVDAGGNVTAVYLLTSSGYPELDQSAIDQARQWRFTPSENGKKGVSARINFQIEGKESSERQKELVKSVPSTSEKSELTSPLGSKREE